MMKYSDFPKNVRDAIDRIAKRANVSRDAVVKAYEDAANGKPVNSPSLFLA